MRSRCGGYVATGLVLTIAMFGAYCLACLGAL